MAGLAGSAQKSNQIGTTGPNGGKAYGTRPSGVPEPTKTVKDHLRASALRPGEVVGSFTVDGESPEDEAKISKTDGVARAVSALAEEVEREPLPREYEEQIRTYQETLLQGGVSSGEGSE
jgi:hypothetical protein